jgi:hypothetical protein
MTIKARLAKLETVAGAEDEVTLEELVLYSYRMQTQRDLDFEARLARSTLGRLIAESGSHNRTDQWEI